MADGVFYAELNELFTRELAEHGYSGVEVRVTPLRTEIIIRATRTQNVLGECLHFVPSKLAFSVSVMHLIAVQMLPLFEILVPLLLFAVTWVLFSVYPQLLCHNNAVLGDVLHKTMLLQA